MHLNVNTIEFDGHKAALNSYSDHPALVDSMNRQRENWAARFPNATVRTERMTEAECVRLVAAGRELTPPGGCYCWMIGELSAV